MAVKWEFCVGPVGMILPPSVYATGFLCRLCDEKGLSRSRAPFDLGDQYALRLRTHCDWSAVVVIIKLGRQTVRYVGVRRRQLRSVNEPVELVLAVQ